MSDRLTVAELAAIAETAKVVEALPDRRVIFEYEFPNGLCGNRLQIARQSDGTVTVTIGDYTTALTVGLPAAQCRKLVAAFATEAGLWPGDCDYDIKAAQAEVGKPHNGALA